MEESDIYFGIQGIVGNNEGKTKINHSPNNIHVATKGLTLLKCLKNNYALTRHILYPLTVQYNLIALYNLLKCDTVSKEHITKILLPYVRKHHSMPVNKHTYIFCEDKIYETVIYCIIGPNIVAGWYTLIRLSSL